MLEWAVIIILSTLLIILLYLYLRCKRQAEVKAVELANEILKRKEREIRRDAIVRSQHTTLGKIGEQLSPIVIFLNYGVDLKDLRFIGSPIDYVAFKGYSNGKTDKIIFIEVKSGGSKDLEEKQKQVKEAVESCRIEWLSIHLPSEIENMKRALSQKQEHTLLKYLNTLPSDA